jgi:hypothetical protein
MEYLPSRLLRLKIHYSKAPRYMFELHSPNVEDLFSLPSGGKNEEGLTDARPMHLEQVTATEFERLLAIFYRLRVVFFSSQVFLEVNKSFLPRITSADYPCIT